MHRFSLYLGVVALAFSQYLAGCAQKENPNKSMSNDLVYANYGATDTATLGAGCFWCVEAVFQQLNGVLKVSSGYSGGKVANPTYEEVCQKNTGHAEVIQVIFDPAIVTYDELLEVFWQSHDPTTLNRQGNDVGPQYRSVVFYHNEEQREKAEHYKEQLDESGSFNAPIVTAVEPFKNFYLAEDYHQNYYINNGSQPYCYFVIRPKMEKFEKVFKDKLKKNNQAQTKREK
ncbi:peptide-methionine (S)-S-oxide reductase MsrA [Flavihumibacter petaseus]|uniref:Peptide methionine sulfoxide reductase MsrA n=1 Tax=Flavihumibacter petaseus NBRC 106054 TaxID=1220578 RepID=A0A0E9N4Q6_9BACT|nr:peptide-methionine (S)-S-oxide reductase MsrA [Flavihumibacter petaseus]GAO44350.1 peptide methionine sulfoxide reductase MsrA [Flavihumibacter petaseus NBRC 106054]